MGAIFPFSVPAAASLRAREGARPGIHEYGSICARRAGGHRYSRNRYTRTSSSPRAGRAKTFRSRRAESAARMKYARASINSTAAGPTPAAHIYCARPVCPASANVETVRQNGGVGLCLITAAYGYAVRRLWDVCEVGLLSSQT